MFFPLNAKEEALTFRANNPEFERRHVKDVIQAYEDRVQYGVIYEKGYEWPEEVTV